MPSVHSKFSVETDADFVAQLMADISSGSSTSHPSDKVPDIIGQPLADDVSVLSDFGTIVENNPRDIVTACILTIFPGNLNKKWLLPTTYFDDTSCVMNWCGQFEQAPTTDTIHAHIFVEFTRGKRPRFQFLAELLKRVTGSPGDIKRCRRTSDMSRKCAANYCLKPDTWIIGETNRFVWPHNNHTLAFDEKLFARAGKSKVDKQSKADLVEDQRTHIESKPRWWTWPQIVHESDQSKALLCTCSWGKVYHETRSAEIPRRTIQNVVILYGAGGTGKTTLAKNWDLRDGEATQERYYRRNPEDGAFWGGGRTAYKGERVIHLEEFCGQEQLSRFKEIADIGNCGPNVNVKNGGQTLNHDTLIITSNHHPAAWYRGAWKKDPKQFVPFWRRISQIWFFPEHRADGSLNIPDEHNQPYYVDQTDEWKSWGHSVESLSSCIEHAGEWWPIRLEDEDSVPSSISIGSKRKREPNAFEKYCHTGKHAALNNY